MSETNPQDQARLPVDHAAVRARLGGTCFICRLIAGDPEFAHPIIYKDNSAIAFLSRYPTVPGYTIVAPLAHKEQVTGDFTIDEYLRLHGVIHRIGEALRRVIQTERLYLLSLGSQQGNSHVHWHVVPLPPGIPVDEQQYRILDRADYLSVSEKETSDLVARIKAELLNQ